jgi:predicted kinase
MHQSVVIDGTFLNREHRLSFYELAQNQHCHFLFVYCHCPKDISIDRIENRKNPHGSEAHSGLYDQQKVSADKDFSGIPHIDIDTTWPKGDQLDYLIEKLGEEQNSAPTTDALRHRVENANNLYA